MLWAALLLLGDAGAQLSAVPSDARTPTGGQEEPPHPGQRADPRAAGVTPPAPSATSSTSSARQFVSRMVSRKAVRLDLVLRYGWNAHPATKCRHCSRDDVHSPVRHRSVAEVVRPCRVWASARIRS